MKTFTKRFLQTMFFCLIASIATAQVANFTADVDSGCAPLVVHFTNTSSGATSYHWDLGNGTVSALTDVGGTYLTAGTYTITLTAYSGSSSTTKTMVITVFPLPTVAFHANDTSVCPGTPVTFTSTTVAGVPGPMTYIWNFGDGTTTSLASPTHTFPAPGYYNITLSVTNAQGCISSLTLGAYIHVYNQPVPNFSVATNYYCSTPGHAVFTDATTGAGPFTYQWSFGDGNTSTLQNPTNDYMATGSYTVRLIVTDSHGCSDTLIRPNYIVVSHVSASFTSVSTACMYTPVMFHNNSSTHTGSQWNWGDGWTNTFDSGTHSWSAAGTYTVTLIVNDGPCTDTVKHIITILPQPPSSFTFSPLEPCPAPQTIAFTATVPSGSVETWSFGDGGSGTGSNPSHTYSADGTYSVIMVVTDPNGCKDTVANSFTIYDLFLVVNPSPRSGCVPLTVNFSLGAYTSIPVLHAYPYPISSYSWNYGDGSSTGTGATPSHTYTAVGVYVGTVTVTTANGCTVSDTFTVAVGTPPAATFIGMPTHICADHAVDFISTIITGPVDQWQWLFGDGTSLIDSGLSASHVYTLPGIFSVTLTVSYHGCPGTPYVLTNYITVDSPKAIIKAEYVCFPRNQINFFDTASYGATTHVWLFGDGTTSTATNPTHSYPSLTTYTVRLATFNATSGCRDTATVVIDLTPPLMSFVADDTAICLDHWIKFTPTVTGIPVFFYSWYVNGVFMEDTTAIYTDTFHVRGIYTISLVVEETIRHCFDTLTKPNYVIVAKPIDSFSATPPIGCWPLTVFFTDHTTDVTGTFITNYNWSYGDGAVATYATGTNTHTYSSAGSFVISEIVTDNIGCKDTFVSNSVTVYRPHAVFTMSNTHPCKFTDVTFNNVSTGTDSSFWIFGDGGTATTSTATHSYTASGTFNVKLVVFDAHGCTDTATNVITVNQPSTSFNMDDSFSICPPLLVHFFNTSTGAVSYQWYFGDGNSSVSVAPTDLYLTTGHDTVMLIATSFYGCKDTAVRYVSIYGYAGAFNYTPLTGCDPLTVHFSAGTLNVPSIIWDFADGIVSASSTLDTISHTYTVPGKYVPKLILSDNSGCQNSSMGTDTIKVDAVYPAFTTHPHPICVNAEITFVDTSRSFFSYITGWHWQFSGTDTSNLSAPTYLYTAVGTFPVTLTATDAWGCVGTAVQTVTVFPPPVITVSPDTTICVGDYATLTGFGGVSYTWSPGSSLSCTACTSTHASPDLVTTYTVTGTDANGCRGTDTVTVKLKTKTVSVSHGDAEVCRGTPVTLSDSGATKFTWLPPNSLNNSTISDPVATPAVTTTYMVIAQLANCIPDTNYVTIVVHPLPTVDAGKDQTITDGSTVQLKAVGTNISSYLWTPAQSLNDDSVYNPKATPASTTTYTISVATDFGCKAFDSVTIHVICDMSQVFIPNSFTPNGDGQNDVFYPRGKGISVIRSFRIYNRWGQLLFERGNIQINDVSNAWDGSYSGASPRPDVYVYIVDAVCENGEQLSIKGDVTIIK